MNIKLFITGTDTECGKTYISTGILRAFSQRGFTTLGVKPVASGGFEDILALQNASSIQLPRDVINPFSFQEAIAPHIAAKNENRVLTVSALNTQLEYALSYPADICVLEGAGGWNIPLNNTESLADFVIHQQLPVILVVGMRLGCLNHALLSHRAIQQGGANMVGWIANCAIPDMPYCEDNILTLQEWLPAPCLGIVRHNEDATAKISIDKIIAAVLK